MSKIDSRKEMQNRLNGFTLLEIMIVILIIGVLAAISIPNFLKARDDAVMKTCMNNQRLIYDAAVLYELETNSNLEGMADAAALQQLYDSGYARNKGCFECPLSDVEDLNDYSLIYEGGNLVDVECTVSPETHVWP